LKYHFCDSKNITPSKTAYHSLEQFDKSKLQFSGEFILCSFSVNSDRKRTKRTPLRERKVSIKQKHGKQRTRMNIGFCLIATSPPPQDLSLSAGVARVKGLAFGSRGSLSGVF
jgi:hypothetical protein